LWATATPTKNAPEDIAQAAKAATPTTEDVFDIYVLTTASTETAG
jgi:hypothetical protein